MAAALQFSPAAGGLPARRPTPTAAIISLNLLEGARQRLELARMSIAQGSNPRSPLRAAMVRIRKLPATLAPPTDVATMANLTELSDYICRTLRTVCDEAGVATLDSMCDLLREIRRGWVTPPAAKSTLRGGSAGAARN